MAYDYGTDVQTLVVDCLPHAMNARHTDWRMRAKAFLEGVEARGWRIVPAGEEPYPAAAERLVARLPSGKYRVVETLNGDGWFVYSTDTDPSFT